MSNKIPSMLTVIPVTSGKFQRYCIVNGYMQYWDEKSGKFVGKGKQATLYVNSNDACMEVQRLLAVDYANKPLRVFRAPIYVEISGDQPLDLNTIKDWLAKASRLLMAPAMGHGPNGNLGLVKIDWSKLREIKE
jgi:hypothetical protein